MHGPVSCSNGKEQLMVILLPIAGLLDHQQRQEDQGRDARERKKEMAAPGTS